MKKITLFASLIVSVLLMGSCGEKFAELKEAAEVVKNISEAAQDTSTLSKEEIQEKMKNYSITLTATDKEGNQKTIVETKNDDGYLINSNNEEILYFDYQKKLFYTLKNKDMSGVAMPMSKDAEGLAGLGGATMYLFAFELVRYLGAKKTDTETIQGRSTTVYELEKDGESLKFWQDKEYGICLKYVFTKKDGKTEKMELSDIKFGNAKIDVDLSKYKITDLSGALGNALKK